MMAVFGQFQYWGCQLSHDSKLTCEYEWLGTHRQAPLVSTLASQCFLEQVDVIPMPG